MIIFFFSFQCGRQLRGDFGYEGDTDVHGEGGVEAARHLPLILRDGRRILSIRRADLCHEVRELDIRRVSGRTLKKHSIGFCYTNVVIV